MKVILIADVKGKGKNNGVYNRGESITEKIGKAIVDGMPYAIKQ